MGQGEWIFLQPGERVFRGVREETESVHRYVRALASAAAAARAAEVERRILEGEDEFQVDDVIYKIPRWREAPIRRAKIAWGRMWRRTARYTP